ncbi:MAG: hypothetical protein KF902_02075 [Phycisphaeraceae bacterium]|nr:hypothetical protein [Phycisphaeraceae bacterium]
MAEKLTRAEAASAVEEILITPRVLNTERYAAMIEELGSLVRAAATQTSAMGAAAEELRVAQAIAGRTLEELRSRTESLGRSVALIDQRLARGESQLTRASEQVHAALEATARVERLAAADVGEAAARLAEAERAAIERVEAASQRETARLRAGSDEGIAVIEALIRDGGARAAAGATEAAHRAAATAAEGIVSRFDAKLDERAAAIRRALLEQATGATDAIERAVGAGVARIDDATTSGVTEVEGSARAGIEASQEASATLRALVERAESLSRPETLEPIRTLVRELGLGIDNAERARCSLTELLAKAEAEKERVEDAANKIRAEARPACEIESDAPPPLGEDAFRELESRSRALIASTEERLHAASAHAERLGVWLAQALAHAQQTGAALEAVVRRAEGVGHGAAPRSGAAR